MKSWVLSFQPEGAKESKEIGIKAKVEFKDAESGYLGFALMLPSNSYETKGIRKITKMKCAHSFLKFHRVK